MARPLVALLILTTACSADMLSQSRPPAAGADASQPAGDAAAQEHPDAARAQADGAAPADSGHGDAGQMADPDAAGPVDSGPQTVTDPPPLPSYSGGACPALIAGRTSSTSVNVDFPSGSTRRQFRLLVPASYDGTRELPVMFAWHWLNASSGSFVRDGELETATEEMEFIAILPDKRLKANGDKEYLFDWPFVDPTAIGAEDELVFFDDMLACVAEQYRIDRRRVYAIGVSAGGLWVTHLSTTSRAPYFAAFESLSGGLGDVAGAWRMTYTPQPNKFPTLVLWGGMNDWLGVNFERASKRYRDELITDGHFVLECVHGSGHAMPPIMPPPGGGTRFYSLWKFMLDHPYGLPPGTSPYQQTGIPPGYPDWCRIATP